MSPSRRFSLHTRKTGCSLYRLIQHNFNGDWSNFYIDLYEEYPCNNKEMLNKWEGEIQREIATINKIKQEAVLGMSLRKVTLLGSNLD